MEAVAAPAAAPQIPAQLCAPSCFRALFLHCLPQSPAETRLFVLQATHASQVPSALQEIVVKAVEANCGQGGRGSTSPPVQGASGFSPANKSAPWGGAAGAAILGLRRVGLPVGARCEGEAAVPPSSSSIDVFEAGPALLHACRAWQTIHDVGWCIDSSHCIAVRQPYLRCWEAGGMEQPLHCRCLGRQSQCIPPACMQSLEGGGGPGSGVGAQVGLVKGL